MPVQDDERENAMIQLFNLTVPADRSRSDIDAHLMIDGKVINFELKSTTGKSVSTVRDFGPDHIRKWRDDLHWIFAFYDKLGARLQYCIYASPTDMEPWIVRKERYIAPDLALADSLPASVTSEMVVALLGEKDVYSPADARWVMKNQWKASEYQEFKDLPDGYSLARMTEIMQQRGRYVILRGSTLNNPHIEGSFFDSFDRIVDEHAIRLRDLVRAYLSAAATDDATE
ncbi:hypothetical protein [Curtobacterium sp. MCBA15_012]|uniref:hypothetical protein n=1 Tax=Curtobacterium sp. MCBA15_012 TaxID=1898738 RepID=UPI0008DDF3DB|nr:hypothetical protein [Curtobacterium sp. MCBA15_012]WIB00352.1 hypothetical protein QOL15_01295 [Curtobacterium sp. MCBA15_012]